MDFDFGVWILVWGLGSGFGVWGVCLGSRIWRLELNVEGLSRVDGKGCKAWVYVLGFKVLLFGVWVLQFRAQSFVLSVEC